MPLQKLGERVEVSFWQPLHLECPDYSSSYSYFFKFLCKKYDSIISNSFYLCFSIPLFIEAYPGSFCLFYCQKISVWKRKVNDVELKRTHLDLIIIKALGTNDFGIHIVAYASLECFILSSERHRLFKLCSCMTSGLKSIITYIISFLNAGLSVGLLTLLYKICYF